MTDGYGQTQQRERIPTFERIRFDLRPAKSIERKMLCEAFRRLSAFERLDRYRYVGFGAIYFTDFGFFHRSLGITDMISIEREEDKRERFEFNRPYRCIDIKFGESTTVLPELSWNTRTVIWLDYDCKLSSSELSDIKHICANAVSGSIVVMTVNAHPEGYGKDRLQELKRRVGEDKIPLGVKHNALSLWGLAKVCRTIIVDEIEQTLSERNSSLNEESKVRFKQLFNFHYQDGARMLTVGGLLYEQGESHVVDKCNFGQFAFFRDDEEPYLIEVPCLTYREIRQLDRKLPHSDAESLDELEWLPQEDVQKYARVYRYFPNFVEAEL